MAVLNDRALDIETGGEFDGEIRAQA